MYTVFVDLDDTLLDSNKNISEKSLKIIQLFISRGNKIVITTARSGRLAGLQKELRVLTPYFIFHNGGQIKINGEEVYRKYLESDDIKEVGYDLSLHNIFTAAILEDVYFANYNAVEIWGAIENFVYTDYKNFSKSAPKLSIMIRSDLEKTVIDKYSDRYNIVYIDHNKNAILSPKNVSKGNAVQIFMDLMDEKTNQSIYIGNDYNDISGFNACDIKVAVANSEKILLEKADLVIEGNNENGVANYLERLLSC
ncbi:MAG: HAD family phosphatase [Treponema sp.]|nr:HAD family phosphatase [Treponema sp.]